MTFLAPLLLSLAAFAGVPLLVHFLRHRVTRRVEFPALRFLLKSEREHSRERTVRNRLLLLLRLLAVLALVVAAARPFATIGGGGHPPVAVAIALDQSLSTRAVVDGQTVFSTLQEAARLVISDMTTDDRGWLVTSGGQVVAGDADALLAAVSALSPSGGRGDFAGAIRRAGALVTSGRPRTPVVVAISDGQRSSLVDATDAVEPLTGTELQLIADVPVVVFVPTVNRAPNRAVLSVATDPARWTPAGRVHIRASGPDSLAWRVMMGTRTVARGVAEAAALDEPAKIDAAAQADESGWLPGRVELDADDFAGDNVRAFAVFAGEPPFVDVRPSAGPFVAAAVEALVADGRLGRATVARAGELVPTIRVRAATEESATPALILAPADPLQVVAANRVLERGGIPWRFGSVLRDTVTVANAAAADGAVSSLLESVRVTQRYVLERQTLATNDSSVVLARAGGTPWLIAGDGYLLLGSALMPVSTSLPLSASFVPWLRDLLGQQLGEAGHTLEVAPDDTLAVALAADSLEAPDGTVRALGLPPHIAPAEQGVYFLRRGARRVGALVVNPEASESDMTPWTTSEWRSRVRDESVTQVSELSEVARTVFARAGGRAIAWPLVLIAFIALALEALVARGVLFARSSAA